MAKAQDNKRRKRKAALRLEAWREDHPLRRDPWQGVRWSRYPPPRIVARYNFTTTAPSFVCRVSLPPEEPPSPKLLRDLPAPDGTRVAEAFREHLANLQARYDAWLRERSHA
jgi:hypothetical protein